MPVDCSDWRELMRDLLDDVVQRAKQSPFYRENLTVEKWVENEIPITTKDDLRRGYPFAFLATAKNKIATYHESSGTEGKPTASYFSENDWKDISTRFLRNAVELNSNDTFFIKTPYSMVTTAHQAQYAARSAGALVVPGDNRSSNMPYSRVVQLLEALEVSVTWSMPTEVLLWRIAAEANGFSPSCHFPKLRGFWVAGEPLSRARKRVLQQLWDGKTIYEDYGSTETGSLAGECKEGHLHLWSDRVHFEVLDATGTISAEGRGQLLVTPLFREAMPLLRYLIEDDVVVTQGQCPCGWNYPTVKVLGRSSQTIRTQGQEFTPLAVEDAIFTAGSALGVALWKGIWDEGEFEVSVYSMGSADSNSIKDFEEQLSGLLGIRTKASTAPLHRFVNPQVLTNKLQFSKPRFLFKRGEDSLQGIQYA